MTYPQAPPGRRSQVFCSPIGFGRKCENDSVWRSGFANLFDFLHSRLHLERFRVLVGILCMMIEGESPNRSMYRREGRRAAFTLFAHLDFFFGLASSTGPPAPSPADSDGAASSPHRERRFLSVFGAGASPFVSGAFFIIKRGEKYKNIQNNSMRRLLPELRTSTQQTR